MHLILLTTALATTPIGDGSQVAVLATASDSAPALAAHLSKALQKQSVNVLPRKEVTARLQKYLGQGLDDVVSIRKAIKQSNAAYAAFDVEKSAKILEETVTALEQDPVPTPEKLKLLEQARTSLADRLLGLAGGKESGRAETALGRKASTYLEACLRTDPLFALSPAKYPPKTRRLMETARKNVRATAIGSLKVTTTLAGATVYLEGRDIGVSPVRTPKQLPLGQYRVWAQKDNHRSKTYVVVLKDKNTVPVEIDLAFEGALQPQKGIIQVYPGKLLTDEVALKTAAALGVDWLVVVGQVEYSEQQWVYAAAYDTKQKKSVRRGALIADAKDDAALQSQAAILAEFVSLGREASGLVTPLDSLGAQGNKDAPEPQAKNGAESDANILLYAGGGVAVVGLVAALGFSVGVTYFGLQVLDAKGTAWEDRQSNGQLALGMTGGAVLGVVALVAGGVMVGLSLLDEGQE